MTTNEQPEDAFEELLKDKQFREHVVTTVLIHSSLAALIGFAIGYLVFG